MKKLLNNPVVVALIAVVAIGSVLLTTRQRLKRFAKPVAALVKNQVEQLQAPAASPATPPAVGNLEALRPLNRDYARAQVDRWVQSPRRDPFSLYPSKTAQLTAGVTNPPVPLVLTAIWRQTGRQLAVINGRVLTEGDEAFDYVIERIEDNVVIVRGPTGSERVEFPAFGPPPPPPVPATNQVVGVIRPVARAPR